MNKKIIVLVCLTAVVWFGVAATQPSSLPLSDKADTDTLRVTTANIYYMNPYSDALTDALISTKSDVFVLPEWQPGRLKLDRFEEKGYALALKHAAPGTHGIGLISKRGLMVDTQLIESPVPGPCRMPLATARIQFNAHSMTLLGVHAPPPITACEETTDPTIASIGKWIDNGILTSVVGSGKRGDPVIVAGDFNAFSFNRALMGLLDKGMADTYARANSGYGPTWSPFSWLPSVFRIDYILSSSNFRVVSSHTIRLPGSDHRGVVSDISVK